MRLLKVMLVLTAIVMSFDLMPVAMRWYTGFDDPNFRIVVRALQFLFVGVLCVVTGFVPAARHPANSTKYLNWLRVSPWRAGLRLPMGAVTPGIVEYSLLALYVAIVTLHLHLRYEVPLMAFMLAFAIPSLLTLARTGPGAAAIAMVFVAALFARFVPDVKWMLIISATLYVIACAAVERSMRKFPWGMDEVKLPEHKLGPVFDRLSPKRIERVVTTKTGIIIAAAMGWWVYCVMAQPLRGVAMNEKLYCIAGGFASVVALSRFAQYCEGYIWPISLWGRIRTGRWIIPGFDYVMVTPLCVAAVGWTASLLATHVGATTAVTLGLTVSLVMLIALLAPPSLAHWRLTGSHRILLIQPRQNRQPQRQIAVPKLLQSP